MSIEIDSFIEGLFAKNKALFGDARMEEAPEKKESKEEAPVEDASSGGDEKQEQSDEAGEDGAQDGIDSLPEWAKKELKGARAEAANYRTQLREAQSKLADAKTPEEMQAAVSELQETNAKLERQLLVSKVARKHELPDELAEVLQGADEAALTAHAKKLQKFAAPRQPGDLKGGLNPEGDRDDEMNPRKLARRSRRY